MNQIAQLSPEKLPHMSYQQKPVITTEVMAGVFQVNPKNLRMNYKNNEARFEEGKHFFQVSGEELSDIHLRAKTFGSQIPFSSKARTLMLWTERGAARHAKMLNTDTAWEVFERMEDFYFNPVTKDMQIEALEKVNAMQDEVIVMQRDMHVLHKKVQHLSDFKLKSLEARTPEHTRRLFTDAERLAIYRMRMTGMVCSKIGKKFGRTADSIGHAVRRVKNGEFGYIKDMYEAEQDPQS